MSFATKLRAIAPWCAAMLLCVGTQMRVSAQAPEGATVKLSGLVQNLDPLDSARVKQVAEFAESVGFTSTKDALMILAETRSLTIELEEKIWATISENDSAINGENGLAPDELGKGDEGGSAGIAPNNICTTATVVAIPSMTAGDTTADDNDFATLCGTSNTAPDVWYRVTGNGTTLRARLCGATHDSKISVFSGACGTLTCVGGEDDDATNCVGNTNDPDFSWCAAMGTEYFIVVHGFSSGTGSFTLDLSSNAISCGPPANDNCAAASVAVDGANPFNTAFATTQAGMPAPCDANLLEEIWYNYTATCTGEANFRTCPGGGAVGPDTVIQIYDGCACPPAGATLDCEDDSLCGGSGFSSNALAPVTMGSCYKIRLSGWNGSDVSGTLEISCAAPVNVACCFGNGSCTEVTASACALAGGVAGMAGSNCMPNLCPQPPPNNDCINASPVVDGPNGFDRANATTDGSAHPLPPCDFPFGDDQIHRDVWFTYTATCTGRMFADTCQDLGIDTRVAVYDGCGVCPPAASPISCNDDSGSASELTDPDQDPDLCLQGGGSPFESATRNQVVAGNCYLIRVGGFAAGDSPAGADVLTVTCETKGACCLGADNSCVGGTVLSECDTLGGTFFAGQACDGLHACCLPNGTCQNLDPLCCTAAGGTPTIGQVCVGNNVACCFGGSCQNLDSQCCAQAGGTPNGAMCEGDADMDMVDGQCGDLCAIDPLKVAPGVCGCGIPDTDTDGDGTADCIDGCPMDPMKIDPGICGCGVSDVDTDGDGVADCLDGCPMDPNKTAPGVCGCGVADVDTDGDGTLDCNDGCPMDPNKIAPGICGCGVSDVDTDGDGVADCNDGCPTDPNKTSPGACGCGVADTDTDLDGVPDCNDQCPTDPNKVAPGICGCGVADTDTDADTVADCIDNCPDAANPDQADADGDGEGDVCDTGEAQIPTVSEWGLVIMALVMITLGKIYFGRRRPIMG